MIVKVQLSLSTTENGQQVLIYNKSRSVMLQVPATNELIRQMTIDGDVEPKLFFHAHIEGENVVLDKYAKWQEW
jgi:hypothetical protein